METNNPSAFPSQPVKRKKVSFVTKDTLRSFGPLGAHTLSQLNSENLEKGGVRPAHTVAIVGPLAGFCLLKDDWKRESNPFHVRMCSLSATYI